MLSLSVKRQSCVFVLTDYIADLTNDEISHIAKLLLEFEIDGVIATNTTVGRKMVENHHLQHD